MARPTPTRPRWRRISLTLARWAAWIALLFAVLYLVGLWRAPKLPTQAPDFTLRDLDGQTVRLDALRGKPIVLNFWATWCPPCRIELPSFARFARSHRNIHVIGIVDPSPAQGLAQRVRSFDLPYRVLIGDPLTLNRYHIGSYPTTVIIDRTGRVLSAHAGLMLDPELLFATRGL